MRIKGHDIGICSWSLKPADTAQLVESVTALNLSHVQLGLGPILALDEPRKKQELDLLRHSGLTLTAAMISFPGEDYSTIARFRATGGFLPDETWLPRKRLTLQAGKLARELGVAVLTTHAGFIPASNHADYPKLLSRIVELSTALREFNITLAFETGQESPSELLQFLNDAPGGAIKVNFDPANMILYGSGNPIEAIATLSRHICHVHVKDAVASKMPGVEWGREVPVGAGQVDFQEFFLALADVGYTGPLVIEREGARARSDELRQAIATLQQAAGA